MIIDKLVVSVIIGTFLKVEGSVQNQNKIANCFQLIIINDKTFDVQINFSKKSFFVRSNVANFLPIRKLILLSFANFVLKRFASNFTVSQKFEYTQNAITGFFKVPNSALKI